MAGAANGGKAGKLAMAEASMDSVQEAAQGRRRKVGLALGSGSARGWAHIGVLQELRSMGIQPDVVVGTSIGALVGAVYVSGQLDEFAQWVAGLGFRDVLGFLDIGFTGGMVKGEKLFSFFSEHQNNPHIEDLEVAFATVATDMVLGREVWIREGEVLTAARASSALPGLFPPVHHDGRWLLDGGLVNPVPVSACRALGADVVIAVNLNGQLVGRHFNPADTEGIPTHTEEGESVWAKMKEYFGIDAEGQHEARPGLFDVMGASINIMQDRITRSRMAGDPADINLIPMLSDYAIMDFHRAEEAIAEGRRLVRNAEESIRWFIDCS